jgi:signal peptidase I
MNNSTNNSKASKTYPKYSLNKCRKILKMVYAQYKKKGKNLTPTLLNNLEANMEACEKAISARDEFKASDLAVELEAFSHQHFRRTAFEYILELVIAFIIAIAIAALVRQMWFEPMEIPTGSMRPTFEEQDHVTVTKTAYGINFPFETKHLYFDPHLIQRTSIVIFSADAIPVPDPDTTYFGIIPYKKRLVKRLVGKPGDYLYFYGGKIYGIDKDGKAITELLDSPWLEKIEYVPFLSFEGDVSWPSRNVMQLEQMHLPLGRINISGNGKISGEIFDGNEWVKDQPQALKKPHDKIKTYSDFLGIRNYAVARLLTQQELDNFGEVDKQGLEKGLLYLQLLHSPNLTYPAPQFLHRNLHLIPYTTIIPLQEHHLKTIMDNMYTARFIVKDELAKRYSVEPYPFSVYSPHFNKIPDGTYEFYYGKAYSIGWGGIASMLPADHPLYKPSAENVHRLFNLGIDMNTLVEPSPNNLFFLPHRYAYFRDGDLYLVGAPIIKKDDPTLKAFNEREEKREHQSSANAPYIAFKDQGPPFKNGVIDAEFIKKFGIAIPPKTYLVLGDNHAMSGDSRVFGVVPQSNLQGAPSLIIWPPGPRGGCPAEKPYPIFVLPRLIVWFMVAVIIAIAYIIYRRNLKKPVYKKLHLER